MACRSNASIRNAGCVIARQRPGAAKGFVFLSLEEETGIADIILPPDVFERDRLIVTRNRFLLIAGTVQNTDGVIHVKAQQLEPLNITASLFSVMITPKEPLNKSEVPGKRSLSPVDYAAVLARLKSRPFKTST